MADRGDRDVVLALWAEQDEVGAEEVVALWTREALLPEEEARRRLAELLLVATYDGAPVGVASAYLRHDPRLRLTLWHFRTFVVPAHRSARLARRLALAGRDELARRWADGHEPRAPGILFVVQNQQLKQRDQAVWPQTGFTFIGTNRRGDHRRVHFFPGAEAPAPGAGPGGR